MLQTNFFIVVSWHRKHSVQIGLNTNLSQQTKETYGLDLSDNYVWVFNRALSQITQQNIISSNSYPQDLVNQPELRSTSIWFVCPRQQPQTYKHSQHGLHSSQFIRDTTQNSVITEQVPFRHNVRGCAVRIRRNIVISVSKNFWIKTNQEHGQRAQPNLLHQVFCIKVRIEIYQISLLANSQWISRSILVQLSKVCQAQRCQNEWKQIVQTIETIQCWIVTIMLVSKNSGALLRCFFFQKKQRRLGKTILFCK